MAIVTIDAGALAMRVAGVFLFVAATVPSGMLNAYIVPDGIGVSDIPFILLLIVIICVHIYLIYRAYYALRFTGFLVLTILYALLAYYITYLLGLEVNGTGLWWNIVAYLTLLYGYGVCYNFIDGYISGLLHTKGV